MPPSRLKPIRRLAAIGLAAPCGRQPAPTIRVAFIGGLSGCVSDLAIDGRNGAQLAIETLNAQSGPRYESRVHDDAHASEDAAAAVDAVADEDDAFAVGPMTSVVARRMSPQAAKRHLVLISPTASSDGLSGIDDWFFRVIPPAGPGAEQMGAEGLRRKSDGRSLRDVLGAPGNWQRLQNPVVLDHFGDSIDRFHLSDVRKGRFVMLPT